MGPVSAIGLARQLAQQPRGAMGHRRPLLQKVVVHMGRECGRQRIHPSPWVSIMSTTISPEWTEYHVTETKEGAQVAGELYFIRIGGSTST